MSAVSFGTSSTASPTSLTTFDCSAQDTQPNSTAPRRKQAKPQRIDEDKKKSSTVDLLNTACKSKINTGDLAMRSSPISVEKQFRNQFKQSIEDNFLHSKPLFLTPTVNVSTSSSSSTETAAVDLSPPSRPLMEQQHGTVNPLLLNEIMGAQEKEESLAHTGYTTQQLFEIFTANLGAQEQLQLHHLLQQSAPGAVPEQPSPSSSSPRHLQSQEDNEEEDQEDEDKCLPWPQCDFCQQTFTSLTQLREHSCSQVSDQAQSRCQSTPANGSRRQLDCQSLPASLQVPSFHLPQNHGPLSEDDAVDPPTLKVGVPPNKKHPLLHSIDSLSDALDLSVSERKKRRISEDSQTGAPQHFGSFGPQQQLPPHLIPAFSSMQQHPMLMGSGLPPNPIFISPQAAAASFFNSSYCSSSSPTGPSAHSSNSNMAGMQDNGHGGKPFMHQTTPPHLLNSMMAMAANTTSGRSVSATSDDDWESMMEVNCTDEAEKIRALVGDKALPVTDSNQCLLCRRVLSCKSALQMHYRTHTGERPFKCKICQRAFTTKGNLKTHMGVHKSKHTFNGSSSSNSNRSMSGHPSRLPPHPVTSMPFGVGQHQCPICQKKFLSSPLLQQHVIGQHTSQLTRNGMFPPVSSVPLLGSPLEAMLNLNFSLNLAQKKCSEAASTTTMSSSSSSNNNINEDCPVGGQSNHSTPSPSSSIQQPQPPITTSEAVTPAEDLYPSSLSKQLGTFPLPFSPSEMAGLVKSPGELNQTPQPMPNFFGFPLFMGAALHPLSMASLFNENHLKEPMTSSPVKGEPVRLPPLPPQFNNSPAGEQAERKPSPFKQELKQELKSCAPQQQSSTATTPEVEPKKEVLVKEEVVSKPIVSTSVAAISTSNPLDAIQKMYAETENPEPVIRPTLPLSKHQCPVCRKHFSSGSALQIHMRTHTGERPFKCEACSRTFTTRGNLKVHMSTHDFHQNPSRRGRRIFDFNTGPLGSDGQPSQVIGPPLGLPPWPPMDPSNPMAMAQLLGLPPLMAQLAAAAASSANPLNSPTLNKDSLVNRLQMDAAAFWMLRPSCPVCQASFPTPQELHRHLEVHINGAANTAGTQQPDTLKNAEDEGEDESETEPDNQQEQNDEKSSKTVNGISGSKPTAKVA